MSNRQPILRWLGTWSPYGKPSPTSSPSSSTSSLTSPSLVSLTEALHEPLALPRLPPPSRSSEHSLAHHPFFDSLTRSTLPTASLSPPPLVEPASTDKQLSPTSPSFRSRSNAPSNPIDSPTINLSHSPPPRSSLDSLRTVSRRDSDFRSQNRSLQQHARSSSSIASSLLPSDSSATSWWWFQSGNKDNVDNLLGEEDRAATIQEEQQNIRRKYHSPKNPVVFCHGLLGFDSVTIGPSIAPMQVTHWRGIKEVLEANGTEVLITRVPATSSPVDRAKVLEGKISEVYPGRSVHLIGHSMGGLDCRYLTTHLTNRKFSVLSITTIATPHRGSSFADHFLTTLGKSRMDSFLSFLDLLPNGGGDGKAFECLTVENMRKFNQEVPDVPGVKYFSWGAVYTPGFVDTWKWPHSVVLEKEGPNDGLVSIESAKWGTYLGTLQDVNHLDLVGWINTARYKWAEMTGRKIKFRPATFYLGVADMLAREVDGVAGDEDTDDNKAGQGADVRPPSRSNDAQSKADESVVKRTDHFSGPTELIFAADQGAVIDDVVVRAETSPPLTSYPSLHLSPTANSPAPTPPPKDTPATASSQRHTVDLMLDERILS